MVVNSCRSLQQKPRPPRPWRHGLRSGSEASGISEGEAWVTFAQEIFGQPRTGDEGRAHKLTGSTKQRESMRMIAMTEPYDIAVMGGIYRVSHQEDEGVLRTCVYSDDQLRFTLPGDTPREEVEKFVRVYALGVSDGKHVGANLAADRFQGQLDPIPPEPSVSTLLQLTVGRIGRDLGKAAGSWRKGAK